MKYHAAVQFSISEKRDGGTDILISTEYNLIQNEWK